MTFRGGPSYLKNCYRHIGDLRNAWHPGTSRKKKGDTSLVSLSPIIIYLVLKRLSRKPTTQARSDITRISHGAHHLMI